jgi:UDP-N-acetylglucosamine:LPS N-acetylglucosamine transferase
LLLGPADGEAARLVIDSGAGRVLEAASGPELAALLDHLERDAAAWAAMMAAAQTVAPDVSRARGLARWLAVLTPSVNDDTAKTAHSSDFIS